jgi:hypothetical protein
MRLTIKTRLFGLTVTSLAFVASVSKPEFADGGNRGRSRNPRGFGRILGDLLNARAHFLPR